MGTWIYGYGYYDPIPIPIISDRYDIFSFIYSWVMFYPTPVLLMGFYPTGTRVPIAIYSPPPPLKCTP
jgi:hypothetical protein